MVLGVVLLCVDYILLKWQGVSWGILLHGVVQLLTILNGVCNWMGAWLRMVSLNSRWKSIWAGLRLQSWRGRLWYWSVAWATLLVSRLPLVPVLLKMICFADLTVTSALPFNCGCSTDVRCCTPQTFKNVLNEFAVNYRPPSVLSLSGTPKVMNSSWKILSIDAAVVSPCLK